MEKSRMKDGELVLTSTKTRKQENNYEDLVAKKQKLLGKFQVREYDPFIVVETEGDNLVGSRGFNDAAGYIFGKTSTTEKINDYCFYSSIPKVSIQIVIPSDKSLSSLPAPSQEGISLRKKEGGIAAALKFSGKPTDDIVREKEKQLRSILIRDGFLQSGCMLGCYNDPRTRASIMVLRDLKA